MGSVQPDPLAGAGIRDTGAWPQSVSGKGGQVNLLAVRSQMPYIEKVSVRFLFLDRSYNHRYMPYPPDA